MSEIDTRIRDLQALVDDAMYTDQAQLRRRLKGARKGPALALDNLERDIRASAGRARLRAQTLPSIEYALELPVSERREEIAAAIAGHQVLILCGETGSGKTTQLPKICLQAGRGIRGLVGHTQPRRIAARATAARIAT
ncbi:MAG: ATP-dependent RNA helicase HrpA, partial [Gammaproteobacteria bacterium]